MTVTIRAAGVGDAALICDIHNQGIADRIATLDTHLRTVTGIAEAIAARGPRHPMIVLEVDGAVVGWGSLNQFNPRAAYDHVADFSVYVERGWRGKGLGRRLLDELMHRARTVGYHKMVLSTLDGNAAGVALYSRCGFTRVGVYHEMGQLDGRWVDVLLMEKIL